MENSIEKETISDARKRWKYRRIMSFSSAGVTASLMTYLTVLGDGGNAVHLMLAQSLPLAFVGLVMAYIGGPIADDWLQLRVNRSV